ncbi:MAG: hypothetical protein RMA76_37610 [Deltaproteobacteria bacterium]|jgi:anti-sigma factor RsiW
MDAEDDVDPRLEALADGTSSAAERLELEREAERDPELARRLVAYQPLSTADVDRLDDIARDALADAPSPIRAPVIRGPWLAVAVLATAAAVLPFVLRTSPLPAYEVEVHVGDDTYRGDAIARSAGRLAPDAPLEVVLRPATRVSSTVEARVYAVRDGRLHPVEGRLEVSPTGAARFVGSVGRLVEVETDEAVLVLVVHRPGEAPREEALAAWLTARTPRATGDGWEAARVVVVVDDR